ncbi:MAG: imidazoleglycerol-phosphate dehydratase HisB [Acidobacteriota bacterium]|nr:MAG: imidazoleglycerol-phosphate dehydratase HisB [Acidobacteriota bacterium]
MSERFSTIHRQTSETEILLELKLSGNGASEISTGVGFLDHMLTLLAKHSRIDLKVEARGDLEVDDHHLVEDVGIVLGSALSQSLGDKAGIERYGAAMLPMDEVLVACAVDLGGRPIFVSDYQPVCERVGDLSTEMVNHFFRSLAFEARMNLHFKLMNPGENEHHRVEGMFKAFARALKVAVEIDPARAREIPSTKGVL